jgi:hypothetical protein
VSHLSLKISNILYFRFYLNIRNYSHKTLKLLCYCKFFRFCFYQIIVKITFNCKWLNQIRAAYVLDCLRFNEILTSLCLIEFICTNRKIVSELYIIYILKIYNLKIIFYGFHSLNLWLRHRLI